MCLFDSFYCFIISSELPCDSMDQLPSPASRPFLESVDETSPLINSHHSPRDGWTKVAFDGSDDASDPMNMPPWRKWACASILGAMTFAATFSSAVFSAAAPAVAKEFNVTPDTMAWATSLYIFGFATGPALMGPASELYGRKLPLFAGYLCFVLSQIPVALSHNIQTILVLRFIGGVASAGSPAIVGGYLADFLPPVERGVAVAIFAATTLIGPCVGSIIGAVLVESPLGWRSTAWLTLVLGVVFGAMGYIILPETYVPVLLKQKAARLRLETGNKQFYSALEEKPVTAADFVVRYLSRPFVMLCLEPILFCMTLYISFTFGMVYLLFTVGAPSRSHIRRYLTSTGISDQLRAGTTLDPRRWNDAIYLRRGRNNSGVSACRLLHTHHAL